MVYKPLKRPRNAPDFNTKGGMLIITVIDAIMGSGKSSAAINYMNEHPTQKFVYITPFLDEVKRITDECRKIQMYEPVQRSEFRGSKVLHTLALVRNGCNVATTHRAFMSYPPELLEAIRKQQYTLIIDEDVDIIEKIDIKTGDLLLLEDAGWIYADENGEYHVSREVSEETVRLTSHTDILDVIRAHTVHKAEDPNEVNTTCFVWALPPELITAFKDTYVLTYMFEGQSLKKMFDLYGLPYSFGGIRYQPESGYHFADRPDYVPSYVPHIKEKIHLVDDEDRLNVFALDRRYRKKQQAVSAFSATWCRSKANAGELQQLKNNLNTFMRRRFADVPASQKMWSSFESVRGSLKGKGYATGFITYNQRATNKYRDRTHLAYCVNVYQHGSYQQYYEQVGVPLTREEQDAFALSTMVQWVWRSAIRDGKDIWLYVPSARMRKLFTDWMDRLSRGEAK